MPAAAARKAPEITQAKLIATIEKNKREQFRVGRMLVDGKPYIGIRVWFKADDGTYRPGKAGVTFRLEQTDAIVEALTKVLL